MYFIKHDINQFEHLITLLIFVVIVIILSRNEEHICMIQKYIDNFLGLWKLDENNNNESVSIFNHNDIKQLSQVVKEWIINDYKSSQCRKWVNWINNKRQIIFSS